MVEQAKSCHEAILVNDLSLRENLRWQIPQSLTVERNAKLMMDVMQPVLEAAQTVILVDRNFCPDETRFVNVLLECINRVFSKQYGPKIQKISYHLGDKYFACDYIMDKLTRHLKHIPQGFVVEFVLRPWTELHDRFILTDIGGVEFGVGLDEFLGHGTKSVRIKLMSDNDYHAEWKKANKEKATCSITGTK